MQAALQEVEEQNAAAQRAEADEVAEMLRAAAFVAALDEPLQDDDNLQDEEEKLGEEAFKTLTKIEQQRIRARDRKRAERERVKDEKASLDYKTMPQEEYEALYKKVR
jgi:hypothetical protein